MQSRCVRGKSLYFHYNFSDLNPLINFKVQVYLREWMLSTITYFIRSRAVSGWLTIQMTVTWIHPFLELLLKSGDYELRYAEIRSSLHTAPLSVLPQAQTRSSVTCRPGVIAPNTQSPAFSKRSAAKLMFNCGLSMWLHLLTVLTWLKQLDNS